MSFSNKIYGCLIGYAIGDALGRGTEFMTQQEAALRYPDGLTDYSQIIRDAHRIRWRRGEYTTDTQAVLEMAESMIECNDIDYRHFAMRYKKWFDAQQPDDFDSHIRMVLQDKNFVDDPHGICRKYYELSNVFEAPNEALGRALLVGCWPHDIEQAVIDNCRITHWDTRCVAAAVITATMANELLWHRREVDYDHLTGIAARIDKRVLPFLEVARNGDISDFDLDDEESYWYVRKNMGVALWVLWHHKDPAEALYEVIGHGGDSNTNAALTMGLMGLKYGYSRMPRHLIDSLIGKEYIYDVADRLIDTLLHADDGADTDDN